MDGTRTNARIFLDRHPQLDAARRRSAVWPSIKDRSRIRVAGKDLFLVYGDALGGEEELFVDRLARGAQSSSDALSRALFLELPEALQAVVRRELLSDTSGAAD